MDNNCNMKWLEWAKELQFLAQVGWICTKDPNHKWKNTVKSVSLGYEKVFNCSFGSIYDQQEKVFDRKPFNRTKAIDFLRNLIIRKEKEDGNKQDEK